VLKRTVAVAAAALLALAACGRTDQPQTPTAQGDLVIGATFAQSGPLAAVGAVGKGVAAYFAKVNDSGGINGRKVKFTSYDDAYDPSRMTANARRAVEQDKAQIFLSFGGPSLSVRPYLNQNKVLHVAFAGNTPFSDVAQFPYTHAWWPDIAWESAITTKYVMDKVPNPKVGVLSLNNDIVDSQAAGIKTGGGDPALVLKVPPNQQDNSSQVAQLQAAGVNVLMLSLGANQIVPTLKYMQQIGYHPEVFLYSTPAARTTTIEPLTPAAATGLHTTLWLVDPADPRWAGQPDIAAYKEDIAKYGGGADPNDALVLNGYAAAAALVEVVKTAKTQDADGYNASWNAVKDLKVPGLLEGGALSAGPGGRLIYQYQVMRFDGTSWRDAEPLRDSSKLGIAK
jgi:branched-chain amino acid transport system substrate-binding protein